MFRVGLNLHRKRLRRLAVAAKHVVRGDDHVPDQPRPSPTIGGARRSGDAAGRTTCRMSSPWTSWGSKSAEAGEVLGIEAVSVRARVHRARAALRTCWRATMQGPAVCPRACRIGHAGRPAGADRVTMRRARRRAITRRITSRTWRRRGGDRRRRPRPGSCGPRRGSDRPGRGGRVADRRCTSTSGLADVENRELGYSLAYPDRWLAPEQGAWPDDRIERACPRWRATPRRSETVSVRLSEASDPADRDGIDHRADRVVAVHGDAGPDDSLTDVRRIRGGVRWTILDEDALTIGGRRAVVRVSRRATWDLYIVDLGERGSLALGRPAGAGRSRPATSTRRCPRPRGRCSRRSPCAEDRPLSL